MKTVRMFVMGIAAILMLCGLGNILGPAGLESAGLRLERSITGFLLTTLSLVTLVLWELWEIATLRKLISKGTAEPTSSGNVATRAAPEK
jgi:hypothetical protein